MLKRFFCIDCYIVKGINNSNNWKFINSCILVMQLRNNIGNDTTLKTISLNDVS